MHLGRAETFSRTGVQRAESPTERKRGAGQKKGGGALTSSPCKRQAATPHRHGRRHGPQPHVRLLGGQFDTCGGCGSYDTMIHFLSSPHPASSPWNTSIHIQCQKTQYTISCIHECLKCVFLFIRPLIFWTAHNFYVSIERAIEGNYILVYL